MMNDLVFTRKNEAVTDSLIVAEYFQKRHDRVLRAIENLLEGLPQNGVSYFIKSSYKDASGKSNLMYLMNRDGFSLLAMGFTGKKALQWKLKYIEAFNIMEKALQERKNEEHVNARKNGMLTRKSETDMLKKLVEYAESQGSTHANMLYVTYTKLVNKLVGVKTRSEADTMQLLDLMYLERIVLDTIDKGIASGADYHDIYQDCKKRCTTISEYAHLGDYSMLKSLPT
jgi:Rha family phage regulatory protein